MDTALVSLHHYFVATGKFGWDLLVKRYSAEPRRLMGLPVVTIEVGQTADLVLFDPEAESTFTAEFMKSKSINTPFINRTLKGRVDLVVLGNEILLER